MVGLCGDSTLTALLAAEYRVRAKWGDRPGHDEFSRHFPDLAAGLSPRLVAVDREIDEERSFCHTALKLKGGYGEYEIVREIARGGMGIVYEARHFPGNRRVALKTIERVDAALF